MPVDRSHFRHDENADDQPESDDHQERCMPAKPGSQIQPDRNAQNLAACKCHLHKSHHTSAYIDCKQVGDNGEADRADHATENAGEYAGRQKQVVGRSNAAKESADQEADVEEQQQLFTVKLISETGCKQPGCARTERVGRYDEPELAGRNG